MESVEENRANKAVADSCLGMVWYGLDLEQSHGWLESLVNGQGVSIESIDKTG